MITELSKQQVDTFPQYVSLWLGIGLATHKDSDKELAERAIDVAYECADLKPPVKKIWVANPLEGCIMSINYSKTGTFSLDRANISPSEISSEFFAAGYGSMDANWLSFYHFFQVECQLECTNKLKGLMEFAKSGGMYWPFKDAVIFCPKPSEIHMENKRLHREGGPAISYDGFYTWALNGVRVEPWMAETPVDQLDTKKVLNIKNVEQRAEVIKRIGVTKLFSQLPKTFLDNMDDYELGSLNFSEGIYPERIYLKMKNPSVDEIHIESVHQDCKTVKEALSWRNFGSIEVPYIAPKVLT